MRCADCKSWKRDSFAFEKRSLIRFEDLNDLGECSRITERYLPDHRIQVLAGEATPTCENDGGCGELITHADFGCVLFEARG